MNKTNQQPKLALNKEVIVKFKQPSYKRDLIHEKERRLITCCDGLTFATTPYKY